MKSNDKTKQIIEIRNTKINILLAEDNQGDIRLTQENFKESHLETYLYAAHDGEESLPFLKRQNSYRNKSTTDLDLSKKDSCDVLKNIQTDPTPMQIPEIILTTSKANEDISQVYNPYANCYITKPVGFKEFVNAVQYIVNFWLKVAELNPPH